MPWVYATAVEGPVGAWIVEFMEKLLARPTLNYTLSAWWGWTPRNYVQPQFANWKDLKWHQKLTRRFLNSK